MQSGINNCTPSLTVSAKMLAEIFEGNSAPFPTNTDGSVDTSIYLTWLNETGEKALLAFDELFDIYNPQEINKDKHTHVL